MQPSQINLTDASKLLVGELWRYEKQQKMIHENGMVQFIVVEMYLDEFSGKCEQGTYYSSYGSDKLQAWNEDC